MRRFSQRDVVAAFAALNRREAAIADSGMARVRQAIRRRWAELSSLIEGREPSRAQIDATVRAMAADATEAVGRELDDYAAGCYDRVLETWGQILPKIAGSGMAADPDRPAPLRPEARPAGRPSRNPGHGRIGRFWPLAEARKAKAPPSRAEVGEIVRSGGWRTRMAKWSKKITSKDRVADKIIRGLARGDSVADIARRVAPDVRTLESSALRIVRTEAARVHNQMIERTFEQFDEIILGFQIVAVLDDRTRPAHRARDGRIWWKGGDPDAADRPELPDEPNCRCTYAPVLEPGARRPRALGRAPRRRQSQAGWFGRQNEQVRRRVVGLERYDAVKAKLAKRGRRPALADFLNDSRDGWAPTAQLKKMTPSQMIKRRERIQNLIAGERR